MAARRPARRRAPSSRGSSSNSSGQMLAQHAGAGAGRRHDIVEAGKCPDQAASHAPRWSRRSPELNAGWPQQVCARGTSTVQPACLQQLDRGEAHRRAEQVDQAGDEQGNSRLVGHCGWKSWCGGGPIGSPTEHNGATATLMASDLPAGLSPLARLAARSLFRSPAPRGPTNARAAALRHVAGCRTSGAAPFVCTGIWRRAAGGSDHLRFKSDDGSIARAALFLPAADGTEIKVRDWRLRRARRERDHKELAVGGIAAVGHAAYGLASCRRHGRHG